VHYRFSGLTVNIETLPVSTLSSSRSWIWIDLDWKTSFNKDTKLEIWGFRSSPNHTPVVVPVKPVLD